MKTVVIIHPHEIVRKGIESILVAGSAEHFFQFESVMQIQGFQVEKGAQCYLYVDTILINESFEQWLKKQGRGKFLLIGIGDRNDVESKLNMLLADYITIQSDSGTILKTLDIPFRSDKYTDHINKTDEELSQRELDVLRFVALGHSNKEIAEKLFISIHTVISHRKNITEKLGIKSISGLTIYAIINKIIDTDNIQIDMLL
jgi:DNA-binding CsgD family transcriptional regulator